MMANDGPTRGHIVLFWDWPHSMPRTAAIFPT